MHIELYSLHEWSVPDDLFNTRENIISRRLGNLDELEKNLKPIEVDVLFLHGFAHDALLIKKIESLHAEYPQIVIVPTCINPNPDFLISLMRLGILEVLTDETNQSVKELIDRVKSSRLQSNSAKDVNQQAKTLALLSVKGGDGASFLSVNLAYSIAALSNSRVLVIDLSLPFGDLDLYITNDKITNNLATFSKEIERMDGALLDSMVHHISPTLHLIPSPTLLDESLQINPANVQKLIQLAKVHYHFVLLDFGRQVGPFLMGFLDEISELVLVASLNIPSARHAAQTLNILDKLGFNSQQVSLVLNRYKTGGSIDLDQFQKVINKNVHHLFPEDSQAIDGAIIKGMPLLQIYPKSKLGRAIKDWSMRWVGKNIKKGRSIWHLLKIK